MGADLYHNPPDRSYEIKELRERAERAERNVAILRNAIQHFAEKPIAPNAIEVDFNELLDALKATE
jgi:hypothetical protein